MRRFVILHRFVILPALRSRCDEGSAAKNLQVMVLTLLLLVLVSSSSLHAQSAKKRSKLSSAVGALEKAAQARADKKTTERYDPHFKKYTKRYFGPGFDWRYFKAQSMAESQLNPNARSRVGARGLMQLMPSTYAMIQSARPEFKEINDPQSNIAAGIMHDRYLWGLWQTYPEDGERQRFMFASYNAGEGTINRALSMAMVKMKAPRWATVETIAPNVTRWRYQETVGYVRRIDSTYSKLSAAP